MSVLRKRIAELLEAHRSEHGWGRAIDIFLITLILANVALIILETVPEISVEYRLQAARMAYADGAISAHEKQALETLREELGLSKEEALNSKLDAQREGLKHKTCPHCGEAL